MILYSFVPSDKVQFKYFMPIRDEGDALLLLIGN